MAIKPLKVNVSRLIKQYASKTDNPKAVMRALSPVLKNREVKLEIGRQFIDIMLNRTLEGKDKNGKDFTAYSKSYKKTQVFKVYKGGKRKPDLKLTGDMQTAVEVTKIGDNDLEIFFNDDLEAAKAEGHVMGANYLPVRDWWGLPTEDEQNKIIADVVKEYNNGRLLDRIEFITETEKAAKEIDIDADL